MKNRPLKIKTPLEEQFKNATGVNKSISIDNLINIEYSEGEYTAVIYDDKIIDIESGNTTDKIFGVAVDIGTTTVVCELVDMNTGNSLQIHP